MIQLRPTRPEELPIFAKLEQDADTRQQITPQTLAQHQIELNLDDVVYLTIHLDDNPIGFLILVLETDMTSVELRRVAVASKGLGIGQKAMIAMQQYCVESLQRERIWLDVYESNHRARHVYEKLGYQLFDSGKLNGRNLLYLQKSVGSDMQPEHAV